MRRDMHRVIISRPRWGSCERNAEVRYERQCVLRARASENWDALPLSQPMRPRRGQVRYQRDLLGPLRRFLRRRCGCVWDDVYSEIRERLSPRSRLQIHVLEHLAHDVYFGVEIRGDRVFARPSDYPEQLYRDGRTFFVHPTTGLLRQPWRRRPRRTRR